MIGLSSETQVWLTGGPAHMQRSFDGPALLVQETLEHATHTGTFSSSRAGAAGWLVHVLLGKYPPPTRPSTTFAREGVEPEVSTRIDWVGSLASAQAMLRGSFHFDGAVAARASVAV